MQLSTRVLRELPPTLLSILSSSSQAVQPSAAKGTRAAGSYFQSSRRRVKRCNRLRARSCCRRRYLSILSSSSQAVQPTTSTSRRPPPPTFQSSRRRVKRCNIIAAARGITPLAVFQSSRRRVKRCNDPGAPAHPASLLGFAFVQSSSITSSMLKSVFCTKTPGILTFRFRAASRCPTRVSGHYPIYCQEHLNDRLAQKPGDLRDKSCHLLLGPPYVFYFVYDFPAKPTPSYVPRPLPMCSVS